MRSKLISLLAAALTAGGLVVAGAPGGADPVACSRDDVVAGQWAVFGGDYGNTRHQAAEATIGPLEAARLRPAWVFSTRAAGGGGDVTGTPAIHGSCLYLATTKNWVYKLNADTGQVVWGRQVSEGGSILSGGIYGTPGLDEGTSRLFVLVSQVGAPTLVALREATGEIDASFGDAGKVVIGNQEGSEVYSSPTVFDGLVIFGVSGGAAELDDDDVRYAFQGSLVIVDARTAEQTDVWTIPVADRRDEDGDGYNDYAGGGIWAPAPAIDPVQKVVYTTTGNPFNPRYQHPNTNAVLKIGVDRGDPATFGRILARYRGTVDEYVEGLDETECVDIPGNPAPYYPQGAGSCMDLDLDFGVSPNVFSDASGRTIVGAGQKSGIYHAFYPDEVSPDVHGLDEMQAAWRAVVGPPGSIGGITGTASWDPSSGTVVGPVSPAGYLFGLDRRGVQRWFSPVADGAHWAPSVSSANGVAYTVDLKGFLDAYDSRTGAPVLHRPMLLDEGSAPPLAGQDPALSWGGVAIARNTVYAGVGIGALQHGYVIAYRPAPLPGLP